MKNQILWSWITTYHVCFAGLPFLGVSGEVLYCMYSYIYDDIDDTHWLVHPRDCAHSHAHTLMHNSCTLRDGEKIVLSNNCLYRSNIKHQECSALFRAARHDGEFTARKVLQLETDINVKLQKARNNRPAPRTGVTPLYLVVWKSHLAIVIMKALITETIKPSFFFTTEVFWFSSWRKYRKLACHAVWLALLPAVDVSPIFICSNRALFFVYCIDCFTFRYWCRRH